jgi:hypothetical protein
MNTMFAVVEKIRTYAVRMAFLIVLLIPAVSTAAKAQTWTGHIDWAAGNTDAGGSVDCQGDYISEGIPWAIAAGGRGEALNSALKAAYRGDMDYAFRLVLLTQCHNPGARQDLINAGEKAVLTYLVQNYTPVGPDPQQIFQAVQYALSVLAAMS